MLSIMIKCMFGGPVFIVKMLPVCKLNAAFQYEQVQTIIKGINSSTGKVVAIVCDKLSLTIIMSTKHFINV